MLRSSTAIAARTRLDGVLSGKVRRDGVNATDTLIALVVGSKFREHIRAVLLQGIALAGFNVVDIHRLATELGVPVVVRRAPRMHLVEHALLQRTPGGARKWKLIQAAGPLERLGALWVQRIGIERSAAAALVAATTLHGNRSTRCCASISKRSPEMDRHRRAAAVHGDRTGS